MKKPRFAGVIRALGVAALALTGCSLPLVKSISSPASQSPVAPAIGSDLLAYCPAMSSCETAIFKWISRIYRPSHEEESMREALITTFDEAKEKLWQGSPQVTREADLSGNLVLRLPATGRFSSLSGRPAKTIALQSHMDMVLAVKGAQPGEDLRHYFKDGVEVEESKGWLQSKGGRTTLGSDNGIGMALALRYLLDPAREHPPLELVFTPAEEDGMNGARGFAIALKASEMISLDSTSEGSVPSVCYGSLGGARLEAEGEMAADTLTADSRSRLISFTLTGLKGGHSGLDIHLPRANAVKGLSWILDNFQRKVPETVLVNAFAGSHSLNRIANSFKAVIAVPRTTSVEEAHQLLAEFVNQFILLSKDESRRAVQVSVHEDPFPAAGVKALSLERLRMLIKAISHVPNGVVSRDGRFPNNVRTSSNMAYLEVAPAGDLDGAMKVSFGTYSRSFLSKDLDRIFERISRVLGSAWKPGEVLKIRGADRRLPPWLGKSDSPLVRRALKESGYFRKAALFQAGLETGFFAERFPRMEVLSLGPVVRNAHTVNEMLELESVRSTSQALARLIAGGE